MQQIPGAAELGLHGVLPDLDIELHHQPTSVRHMHGVVCCSSDCLGTGVLLTANLMHIGVLLKPNVMRIGMLLTADVECKQMPKHLL